MLFTLLRKNSRSFENMKSIKTEECYLGKIKTSGLKTGHSAEKQCKHEQEEVSRQQL